MPDGVVLTYSYNGIGQINTLTSNHGDIVDALAYSPLSQVKTIDYANDVISIMTYDPAQMYRMTDKLTEDNTHTTTFQDIAYTYDNVGNITDLVEASGSSANKTAAYVYDDLYRLISATITNTTSGSNYTHTFTFDSIGNILTKSDQGTYTYAETGKVNPHAVTLIDNGTGTTKTYTYDDNGNMTEEVFDDGTDTITKTMTWDHLNRMIETEVDDGTDVITVTYTYDQGGRRLKKIVDDGTTTETTRYPFSDYEVTVSGSTKTTVKADTQHVATIEDDGLSTLIYFHHDDHLGGANVVTSVVGALVQVIDYFPFGSVRVDDKSSTYDSTQKFTGHELDDATGLYYAQARYYDSEIGRFTSQDPLQWRVEELMKGFSKSPQALNFYSYTVNNPLIFVDPDGEKVTLVGRGINTKDSTGTNAFGAVGVHTFLLIQPDNPDDFSGIESFILGAYDKDGTLTKAINDPSDVNAENIKETMVISAPDGQTDTQFISGILNAYGNYSDNIGYPTLGLGTNSNSFTLGLLMGAEVDQTVVDQFNPFGYQPGWSPISEMLQCVETQTTINQTNQSNDGGEESDSD